MDADRFDAVVAALGTRRRALLGGLAAVVAVGLPALLGAAPAAARLRNVTKRYDVAVVCDFTFGGFCTPAFIRTVGTRGILVLEFEANPLHCTPIRVRFHRQVAGVGDLVPVGDPNGYVVDPGASTPALDAGALAAGQYTLYAQAGDAPGGTCADGDLSAWEGKLWVTTSKRVRRR